MQNGHTINTVQIYIKQKTTLPQLQNNFMDESTPFGVFDVIIIMFLFFCPHYANLNISFWPFSINYNFPIVPRGSPVCVFGGLGAMHTASAPFPRLYCGGGARTAC